MSTERTLERIDDALDDWDSWDGHSPDAARWDGGPDEGEWRPGDLDDDEGDDDCLLCYAGTIHLADMCESRIDRPEHRDISFSGEQRLYMVEPENADAPTMAELDNATELGTVTGLQYGEPSDFTFPQRLMVGIDPASPQHVGFMVAPEVQRYVESVQESFARMAQAVGFTLTEWQRIMLGHFIDPALWDRAVQRPPRPTPAAERTRSARWRAGSRRNKRHARRRQ